VWYRRGNKKVGKCLCWKEKRKERRIRARLAPLPHRKNPSVVPVDDPQLPPRRQPRGDVEVLPASEFLDFIACWSESARRSTTFEVFHNGRGELGAVRGLMAVSEGSAKKEEEGK
jgi:hypothetical protein